MRFARQSWDITNPDHRFVFREMKEMTEANTHQSTPEVTIRRLGMLDDAAVTRIAELDSVRAPRGELFGAEVDGRLVALVSATTGEVAADPSSAPPRSSRC